MPSLPPYRLARLTLPLALLLGCARPGPPRAPSLRIPAVVTDLTASRSGDVVELHFTAPTRASDGVPLPAGPLRGVLCRQLGPATPGTCVSVAGIDLTIAPHLSGDRSAPQAVSLQDALPAPLTTGAPQLLSYRVQFFNPEGRSLGDSEPAYSVAGAAPPPVAGFTASGARNGVILNWTPAASDPDPVLLERTDLAAHAAPKPQARTLPTRPSRKHAVATPVAATTASANVVWLEANADGRTLDTTLDPDTPYQYRALRRRTVHLGGRTLELRSALSAPQPITLLQVYPPAAPAGLTAAAYFERFGAAQTNELPPTFAVDLIWQPIDDDTRTAALTGYNIYRETLDAQGNVLVPATRLNPAPVPLPAFHDTTAQPHARYRYRVTAIDAKNNESPPATTILEAQPN